MNLYELSVLVEDKIKTFNAEAEQTRLAREARGPQRQTEKFYVQVIMLVLAGLGLAGK